AVHGAAGWLGDRVQRRDARGVVALQRRHAAQRRAGDLCRGAETVSRRAVGRTPPAPGEVRQARELELSIRLRVELTATTVSLWCRSLEEPAMARVTGIGGVFFKSTSDNVALAAWYQKHLGMRLESFGGAVLKWPDDKSEDKGMTVWHVAE